jgi:hypothetical protein
VGLVNTHLNDLSLTERHEQALFTYVTRFEKGRFGLWVKQDTMKDFEREKAIESKIRASILTHAEDLSSKNKGD